MIDFLFVIRDNQSHRNTNRLHIFFKDTLENILIIKYNLSHGTVA